MITIDFTQTEAAVLLEMINHFSWAGKDLEATTQNITIANSLKDKFIQAARSGPN